MNLRKSKKADDVKPDTGKFYVKAGGDGQISTPKALTSKIPFAHTEKVLLIIEDDRLIVQALDGGALSG